MNATTRQPIVDRNGPTPVPPSPMLTPDGLPSITDWTLAPGVLHLNHGSYGGVPRAAQEAQAAFRATMDANPCGWFNDLPERVAGARRQIADFLGSAADSTALVPNASAGASVVFDSIPCWHGMEIVTTDHTYGAVLMGAQRLARKWAGTVRAVHVPLSASDDEAFDLVCAELTDNTALIVIDQITSATARHLPAGLVAAEGRRRGIAVLVDAAHAPGVVASPLAGVDADFWIGNLHKFACAPRGAAALVAAGPHTQRLYPLIDSWENAEPFPGRFDQQGTLDVTAYLAAPVAFGSIQQRYGWDEIRRYNGELADYAQALITASLSEAVGEDCSVEVGRPVNGLRLVGLPTGLGTTPEAANTLRRELAAELGIETAMPSWRGKGYLRLSAHVYNTPDHYLEFAERAIPLLAEKARTAITN
jgi:isopenicillin-N epimerase